MTESRHDFDTYSALSPEDRMKARLQGLAEVVSASGLPMLADDTDEPFENQRASDQPLHAFGEAAATFAGQRPVFNPQQIRALSTELKLPEARVAAALDAVFRRASADRAP